MMASPASGPFLAPTQQSGREFSMQGEVIMLNLLRFRETADYSAAPELAPDSPIRGAEAFLAFAENKDCMAGLGHRTAAVEDSRLLPLSQISLPAGNRSA